MSVKISRYPKKFDALVEGKLGFNIVESVSIDYDISWESISVYGRQDAIQSYKTTGQTLSVQVATTISPQTIDGKYFTDVEFFRFILKSLNSLCRPVYEGGVIVQSPLWRVALFPDKKDVAQGYALGQKDVIIAPTSLSVDYGDRIRKIEAVRGKIDQIGFGEIETTSTIPKRLAISFGGPIINTKQVFVDRGSPFIDGNGPIIGGNSPQSNAVSVQVLDPNFYLDAFKDTDK